MGLPVLGSHRAGRRGQPKALLAVVGVLFALDPDDHLAGQGRSHYVPQVVEDGLDTIETVDVFAVVVRSGLPEVLVLPAAADVVTQAVRVMRLALGRGRKPERVVLDEFSVWRLVVVHLREAHARFGLCPAVMAETFA